MLGVGQPPLPPPPCIKQIHSLNAVAPLSYFFDGFPDNDKAEVGVNCRAADDVRNARTTVLYVSQRYRHATARGRKSILLCGKVGEINGHKT